MSFLLALSGIVCRLLTDSRRDPLCGNCQKKGSRTSSHIVRCTALALGILLFREATAEAESIMPLGDSITYGGWPTFNVLFPGGFRTRLYTDLQKAGIPSTLVGTSTDNASRQLIAASQTHHEGHPGYRIDQIASNLDGNDGSDGNNGGFWFHKPAPPGIILLHVGTNDILQNFQTFTMAQRLDKLIGQIVADSPASVLFVSSIIPIGLNDNLNQLVQAYNKQIKDVIVPKYHRLGEKVIFVDQYRNFVDAKGSVINEFDGIHPDGFGYERMGDTWAAALQQAIPEPSSFLLMGLATLPIFLWLRSRSAVGCGRSPRLRAGARRRGDVRVWAGLTREERLSS